MSRSVQTPTALVATAECSVPNLLPFAVMGSLAVVQNLRKNLGVPICVLLYEGREEVGHRAHLWQLKTQSTGLSCRGEKTEREQIVGNTEEEKGWHMGPPPISDRQRGG